jgi:16S rRNA (uracil1498-N3)-methyltransferase
MEKPLFYSASPTAGLLPEAEAYHIYKVLRARAGTEILLTDGKGLRCDALLTEVSPKRAAFQITHRATVPRRPYHIRVAVAPTRKPERNEWMLEKLVEFGVDEVDFIRTAHTHNESFLRVVNQERMERIAIAAMKQSRQFYLPDITIGKSLQSIFEETEQETISRFIAYVPDKSTAPHLIQAASGCNNAFVLIGPEGDFTPEEVKDAIHAGFELVSLGQNRLRTETAALAACHSIHLAHSS